MLFLRYFVEYSIRRGCKSSVLVFGRVDISENIPHYSNYHHFRFTGSIICAHCSNLTKGTCFGFFCSYSTFDSFMIWKRNAFGICDQKPGGLVFSSPHTASLNDMWLPHLHYTGLFWPTEVVYSHIRKFLLLELSVFCNVTKKITLAAIMFFTANARSAFTLSLRQSQLPSSQFFLMTSKV